ncbi:MAG TPA: hypothetical protein VF290_23620 [Pyrinomonadaceae bacterium]
MPQFIHTISEFFARLIPNAAYPLLVAFIFVVLGVLGFLLLLPKYRSQRANLVLGIAATAKLSPADLASTIQRLSQDTQVQYIWTLYNNFTEFSGGLARSTEPRRAVLVGG